MRKYFTLALFVTATIGATAQEVITLEIGQPEKLAITVSDDATINEDEQTALLASPTGGTPGYTYKWTPSKGISSSTVAGPSASPSDTTTYVVKVTDSKNCTASDTVVVNVVPKISGVSTAQKGALGVYPNPVKEHFFVDMAVPGETATVSLLSIDGKEIWEQNLPANALKGTRFDAPAENGLYLLKISSGSLTVTQSLVVSK